MRIISVLDMNPTGHPERFNSSRAGKITSRFPRLGCIGYGSVPPFFFNLNYLGSCAAQNHHSKECIFSNNCVYYQNPTLNLQFLANMSEVTSHISPISDFISLFPSAGYISYRITAHPKDPPYLQLQIEKHKQARPSEAD